MFNDLNRRNALKLFGITGVSSVIPFLFNINKQDSILKEVEEETISKPNNNKQFDGNLEFNQIIIDDIIYKADDITITYNYSGQPYTTYFIHKDHYEKKLLNITIQVILSENDIYIFDIDYNNEVSIILNMNDKLHKFNGYIASFSINYISNSLSEVTEIEFSCDLEYEILENFQL